MFCVWFRLGLFSLELGLADLGLVSLVRVWFGWFGFGLFWVWFVFGFNLTGFGSGWGLVRA